MNIYKTGQRKVLMNFLIKNKDRFINADEILQYIKKSNKEVSLTTIYRFLNLLEKENKVRTETKNHKKYYQLVSKESNNHLFLKCKTCGKSMDINCKEFENVNQHIKKEHKFKLDYNTIIYGTCDNCSK